MTSDEVRRFDCVRTMRAIRDQISAEITEMSFGRAVPLARYAPLRGSCAATVGGATRPTEPMITRVEALNFRCLRYVHRPMNPFHVLVGPNASGKTTFLDVIGLLGDIVSGGLDYALSERTPNPQDLLFGRRGSRLELAVEATVPDALRQPDAQQWNTVRYQVALGYDDTDRQFEFKAETLLLKKATESGPSQRELFPTPPVPPESLLDSIKQRDNKVLVTRRRAATTTSTTRPVPQTEAGRRRSSSERSGRRWATFRPTKARFRRRRGFGSTLAPAFSGSPSTVA